VITSRVFMKPMVMTLVGMKEMMSIKMCMRFSADDRRSRESVCESAREERTSERVSVCD
jgi:hypothetical protein